MKAVWALISDEADNNELIVDPNCIIFEISSEFIYILNKFRTLEMSLINNIDDLLCSEEVLYKIDITDWIIEDSLSDYFF